MGGVANFSTIAPAVADATPGTPNLDAYSALSPAQSQAMGNAIATAAPMAASATPMAATTANASDPNTATLGTGQTSNPFSAATNPYIQAAQATTMGNLYGARAATQANRINQNTPYASLNYTQSIDANGNPVWTANQQLAQPLQSALGNIQGQLAQATATPFDVSQYQASQVGQGPQFAGIGNAPNLQSQVQGTGMEGWDRATGLLMSRLQPQIEQSQERLQAQLANQGIAPGTEAYNRAMTQQAQKTNDLMTQAQLAGSQVQNTMFGQNLAAGQFGNQALTQQNANQLANLAFNNQLGQQGFANQLAGTQANNAARLQNYQQALAQRNLPLQQLGAFQQATQPGYINPYTQAAVSGPDYLGAYTTSRAADIAAQNAQAARTANLQNGLFGLGSSAILGAGGIGNLGSSILGGATTLGGLLGLGGTPGLGQTTNWLGQVVSDPTYGAGDIYNNMTPDELTNMFEWGI